MVPGGYELLEPTKPELANPLSLQLLFALLKQEGFIDARWYREQREYLEMWHPKSVALLMKYRDFDAIPDSEFGSLAPGSVSDLIEAFRWHDRRFMINNGYNNLMNKSDIIQVLTKSLQMQRLPLRSVSCTEVPGISYDLVLNIELSDQAYSARFIPRGSSWPPQVWKLVKKMMFEQLGLLALHMPGKSMVFISPILGQALERAGFASVRSK